MLKCLLTNGLTNVPTPELQVPVEESRVFKTEAILIGLASESAKLLNEVCGVRGFILLAFSTVVCTPQVTLKDSADWEARKLPLFSNNKLYQILEASF